jgi:hypothetical protein
MRHRRRRRPPATKTRARTMLRASVALIVLTVLAISASSAQAAFGPEVFEDGTCNNKTCTYASVEANPSEAFTQAAGHPPWGGTKFIMRHSGSTVEGASVKRIRVDVPSGLAADPQAPLPKCAIAQFDTGPSGCPSGSVVGTTEMEAVAEPLGLLPVSLSKLEGTVYNLEAPAGLPLDFGIAVEPAGELITPIHLFLEGHLDWSGDYHEYFEINNVPDDAEVAALPGVKSPLKVLMSKLNFNGRTGGDFLTLPSVCSNTTTSHLELESWSGEIAHAETHTPVGVSGCGEVGFAPQVTVTPTTSASDQPDGVTVDVRAPQHAGAEEINTADISEARVTLPQGMTLNPSAAHELQACTAAQIAIGTTNPVTCPAASRVGTVTIETDLPPGSLSGPVFLGSPSGGAITGPPYTIYLDAESIYGVSVRLQGSVTADPSTGRLQATFAHNPQLPFSELILSMNAGARAPLANPLQCANAPMEALFTPYTGLAAALSSTPFAATGCPSPLPFSLGQSTQDSSPDAGAYTSYTFNLARADGQQYLAQVQTTLPAGLLGAIPSVPLCGEPQAQLGSCAPASQIGTATVSAGAGPEPYAFSGPVYLTGPYEGAPYGLSIPVAAVAGPFDFGTVLTRAAISVDPYTARPIVTSSLPTIVDGVPLRLRTLSVSVDRPSFLFNPTNCGPLASETTLTSTLGATQNVSSPFAVGDCGALAFKPSFQVSTAANTSKAGGASLRVLLTQPAHEANMKSVSVRLPKQLPSRLTTLQKACPEATFAANPVDCRPLGAEVGNATVTTPVLPGALTGSVYLVSHGGAAFPDLDLVLEGDGVRVILTGNTNIKGGITSSTFAAIPDVPVSSFVLSLPVGPHSALSANGSLCKPTQTISERKLITRRVRHRLVHIHKTITRQVAAALSMPTTITGQNGAVMTQNTRIAVSGCPVKHVVSHQTHHRKPHHRKHRRDRGAR